MMDKHERVVRMVEERHRETEDTEAQKEVLGTGSIIKDLYNNPEFRENASRVNKLKHNFEKHPIEIATKVEENGINSLISDISTDLESLKQKLQKNVTKYVKSVSTETAPKSESIERFQNIFASMDESEVRYLVNAVFDQILNYMKQKKPRIVLRNIGVFVLKERPPAKGKAFGKDYNREKGYWYYKFKSKRFE
ncbi:MAG: hypothetical protein QXU98_12670 [Candidatus Parvarchaeota archaeon]